MTDLLISVDVGGTLGHVDGPSLAAVLADASPLDPRDARRIMRQRLHTRPAITDTVVTDVCEALGIPEAAFPRTVSASPVVLIPGALEALRAMSEHATLVTLSNVTCVEAGTDQLRELLSPWVSDHFPSCLTGYAKPDPGAFEAVAHAYGLKTADIVHIGDDWECDIVGATSVNAAAIWISGGRLVPDDGLVVDSNVLVAADLAAASRHVSDLAARRQS
jgi:FMN phosphatase YigB (HAD superfamily)